MLAPVFFISHGHPMNALKKEGKYVDAIRRVGEKWKSKVKAALVISGHYITEGNVYVVSNPNPETIHDFRGLPDVLNQFQYPTTTSESLVNRLKDLLGNELKEDAKRGIDHGAWAVLCHLFPNGDVPIAEMSLNFGEPLGQSLRKHYEFAKKLRQLREEGVMIVLSGGISHNLPVLFHVTDSTEVPQWLKDFDDLMKKALKSGDHETIVSLDEEEKYVELYKSNHPTVDHFVPLMYLLGAQDLEKDKLTLFQDGEDLMSMCMVHVLLEDSAFVEQIDKVDIFKIHI